MLDELTPSALVLIINDRYFISKIIRFSARGAGLPWLSACENLSQARLRLRKARGILSLSPPDL